MATSGTFLYQPSNASIVLEAFDRCRIRPQEVDTHMSWSARQSLNLELIAWSNRGFNLWKEISGTITLIVNPITATYTLPANLVTLSEVFYTNVNGLGVGQNLDRIMIPITRTQYAMLPNKNTPGIPTQYWFQMLATPQITLWQPPSLGTPNYAVNWYGLQQIQDANVAAPEQPDIVNRATEALCAGLAVRLFDKFGDDSNPARYAQRQQRLMKSYDDAWADFVSRDQELGPIIMQPNIAAFGKI